MADQLTDRIAQVLAGHLTHRHERYGDLWHSCSCNDGVRYYDRRKWAAHVAEVVVAALQLRHETREADLDNRTMQRWVTSWVGVLGEEPDPGG